MVVLDSEVEPVDDAAPPEVTVVVIGYRHADYIHQCLESISAQTMKSSCIIIDDASGDGTERVVLKWVSQHQDVDTRVVVHKTNRGLISSLNEALSMVSTPYFAYIAADDWMEPNRLELQIDAMNSAGDRCALVYSDVYRADERGQRCEQTYAQLHSDQWRSAGSSAPYKELLSGNWIPAPSVLLRADAVRAVGSYDEEIFFEDHDMYLRIAREFTILRIDTPLATHRELSTSYGHRMFFTEEGQRDFHKAQVNVLIKHVDDPSAVEAGVVEKLRVRISQLYWEGESPAWIHPRAKRLSHALSTFDVRLHLIVLASRLGIHGPVLRGNRTPQTDGTLAS